MSLGLSQLREVLEDRAFACLGEAPSSSRGARGLLCWRRRTRRIGRWKRSCETRNGKAVAASRPICLWRAEAVGRGGAFVRGRSRRSCSASPPPANLRTRHSASLPSACADKAEWQGHRCVVAHLLIAAAAVHHNAEIVAWQVIKRREIQTLRRSAGTPPQVAIQAMASGE